jgi:hypothetical protein
VKPPLSVDVGWISTLPGRHGVFITERCSESGSYGSGLRSNPWYFVLSMVSAFDSMVLPAYSLSPPADPPLPSTRSPPPPWVSAADPGGAEAADGSGSAFSAASGGGGPAAAEPGRRQWPPIPAGQSCWRHRRGSPRTQSVPSGAQPDVLPEDRAPGAAARLRVVAAGASVARGERAQGGACAHSAVTCADSDADRRVHWQAVQV